MNTKSKAPEFLVVIPARLGSTRLPRKPLADLAGKPMIVRVAERAKLSLAQSVIVATDSAEIQAACNEHQIECLLTRTDHPTGTDRLAEIVQLLKLPANALVVNVQGDEPLIPPDLINQVAQTLADHTHCAISTVATAIYDKAEIDNPNGIRFCFSVGQLFNRTAEVWASNNNYLMDGQDMTPEEKIMGIKVSDIPPGHELRMLYPGKFRK